MIQQYYVTLAGQGGLPADFPYTLTSYILTLRQTLLSNVHQLVEDARI